MSWASLTTLTLFSLFGISVYSSILGKDRIANIIIPASSSNYSLISYYSTVPLKFSVGLDHNCPSIDGSGTRLGK